jgi:hypothetical protein
LLPAPEVIVHRRPRWKFTRQQTPLTAGPKQIENGVHYSPYINASGTTPRFSFRNYRIHQRPLRLRQIRCVYPHSCLQNLERSLRARLVTARSFQTPLRASLEDAVDSAGVSGTVTAVTHRERASGVPDGNIQKRSYLVILQALYFPSGPDKPQPFLYVQRSRSKRSFAKLGPHPKSLFSFAVSPGAA